MVLVDIQEVILNIVEYVASAADEYIKLSTKLNDTHSIINPKNEKIICFYWVILAYFYIISDENYKDQQRITKLNSLAKDLVIK